MTFLIYIAVGVLAGLSAGLFGVGGGLVIVPTLVFCFTFMAFEPAIVMQLAVGSSLATIVVTSISSVRAHHALGNIDWALWSRLAPGIAVGVVFGVNVLANSPGEAIQLAFGVFMLCVAVQMGFGLLPAGGRAVPGIAGLSVAGGVIGFVSALFGIGGGSLTVPFLSWCNLAMRNIVAISAACGLPIAVVATVSNIWVGWESAGLPPWSSGFVYWPAVLGVVISSYPCAKLGARLAQKLPDLVMKRIFALFLLVIGSQFIFGFR